MTTSPLPGTTLQFIRIELGGSKCLYDTPGLLIPGSLTERLTPEELKIVVPKKYAQISSFILCQQLNNSNNMSANTQTS